ncbi:hypothetical protein [Thioalkalivibrio sp. ALMg11]|uniref:hypothetical protein n=1 Tax=Thioalkalivibrio sp. ALMg11 TaxID=1158165 RepID=UPI0003644C6C|nr:hypothetical protein [Thioalkalivibrio sp. ALMg11]
MILLVVYSLAVLAALVMLLSRRRAALGVRVLYALATLVLPFATVLLAHALNGGEASGAGSFGVVLFAFFGSPLLMWWVFAYRHPAVAPEGPAERGVGPGSPPPEAAMSAVTDDVQESAVAAAQHSTARAQVFRRAALVQTPGSLLLGMGLAEKLGGSDGPIFPFLANGWLVDGMLGLGAVLLAVSLRMIVAELRRASEPQRDADALGIRNPRR